MALTALTAIATGPSAVLNGTASIPATAIPSNATYIGIQMNVANHLAGNNNSINISIQISLDGGATWTQFATAGRAAGSPLPASVNNPTIMGINWAGLTAPLPDMSSGLGQVRGTITTSGATNTAMRIVPFSGSL